MKIFKAIAFEVQWWLLGHEHKLATMTKNPDGTMDVYCTQGCRSRLRYFPYPGDRTKTLGDRLKVESTDCPLYIAYRKRHGQAS